MNFKSLVFCCKVAAACTSMACASAGSAKTMVISPVKAVTLSQANIVDALAKARPGDSFVLSPGGYGVVVIPKKVWAQAITIDARAASVAGLVLRNTSGVNWIGGTIVGSIYGVTIQTSSNVSITGADISGAQRGIVVSDSTDVQITRNKLHHLRTDGIDIVGQRILVEGNTITDMAPIAGDHPDGVQVRSVATFKSRDITIRANIISGKMQGIFARAPGIGIENMVVTGNQVTVAYPNGIVLADVTKSVGTGNLVRSPAGATNKANMRAVGDGNKLCGNAVPDVPNAPAAQPCQGG